MSEIRTDILIAGAGAAGLSAAIALAQRGRKVTVAGRIETARAGRTIALLGASMRFYEAIGLAEAIAARGASLRIMRIIDDTGSLFRLPQADFDATVALHPSAAEEFVTMRTKRAEPQTKAAE